MNNYDGILHNVTPGGRTMIGIFILVRHVLKYKRIMGVWPTHKYLMVAFEYDYEVIDHVLMVAKLVQP